IFLSIWFHDAVCKPGCDNEKRSAKLVVEMFKDVSLLTTDLKLVLIFSPRGGTLPLLITTCNDF
ncbi:MAG: hypothetical protein NZM39_07740, partial [Bernardetiaceae bacterium]|nr:hypothetical protein [Bernardetiaceae bacterium]